MYGWTGWSQRSFPALVTLWFLFPSYSFNLQRRGFVLPGVSMADGNCSSIQPPFTVLTVIRPSPPSSIFNDKHFIFILFLRFGDFLKIRHEFARKYWAVCEKGSNMDPNGGMFEGYGWINLCFGVSNDAGNLWRLRNALCVSLKTQSGSSHRPSGDSR